MEDSKRTQSGKARFLIRELFVEKRRSIFWATFFITLKALPVWIIPVVTARIIDLGSEEDPSVRALVINVGIALLLIGQNLPAAVLYIRNLVQFTRGIGRDLRIRICEQLQALSLSYHRRSSVGSLHSKAIRDIEILEQLPRMALEQGYTFVLGLTISSIAIVLRKPEALLFFVIAVPVSGLVSGAFRKRMSGSVNDYRKSLEGMSTFLNEMVTMMPITRAHALEDFQMRTVEKGIGGVFQRGVVFDKLTGLFAAVSWVVMGLMQTLFLGGSMYACFQKQITVGDVVMFNAFFLTLSNSLANLLSFVPQLLQTRESLDSVIEILAAEDLEGNEGKPKFEALSGSFEISSVSYQYPETGGPVINDLSLKVEAGTSLAIAGPSGCGKSTLLSLLLGFVHPSSGKILLDGEDMAAMDMRSYRKRVGVVTQDSVFFSGSIRENVAYGYEEVEEDQLEWALQQSNACEFIDRLPDGLDTRIGVNGVRLSGGQMQRLAIARAIVRNPSVLVLDEATSALDNDSEVHVRRAIDRVMKGRTTFIVAHRLSTIRNADRIAILDAGCLVDCGSPDELLKKDNFYSRSVSGS